MGHFLLISGLALGVFVVSKSDIDETSVLCEEITFLELLVFFSALSGFVVVAAEEDR